MPDLSTLSDDELLSRLPYDGPSGVLVDAELRRRLSAKDAEIERLREEIGKVTETVERWRDHARANVASWERVTESAYGCGRASALAELRAWEQAVAIIAPTNALAALGETKP